MSINDKSITHEQVIPVVESRLFEDHPTARFAIGILAVEDVVVPGLENEYQGYFDLRRNVYVEQTGQLHPSELNEEGKDHDADDARSVAFGIIENRIVDQRVVAATRLIIKGFGSDEQKDASLPIESFCPDIFGDNPAPNGSLEVSRLIARHEKARMQDVLRSQIYAASLAYIDGHNLGPTYGVIEPWLQRFLQATIPVEPIGEARYVEHYLDYNVPIRVDTEAFVNQMNTTHPGAIATMQQNEGSMTYFGKAQLARRVQNVIPLQPERHNADEVSA
ncbi:MAG: family N-acetyltransferase [Candidatus Saccharibacteria bacterium]|nr:family N-acetyltransferase [Candidatus Saccharibacteria bacterium]